MSGESHYFQGRRYILDVKEHEGYSKVELKGSKRIVLKVPKNSTIDDKSKIIKEWYRKQLKIQIPRLLEKWEKVVGVKADDWGVKQMKTKWGACNTDAKRIWLNLELAKKPPICLEYILVHELVHLHERSHNDRFIALMNKFMPKWRLHRDELNGLPIVHNDWGYLNGGTYTSQDDGKCDGFTNSAKRLTPCFSQVVLFHIGIWNNFFMNFMHSSSFNPPRVLNFQV